MSRSRVIARPAPIPCSVGIFRRTQLAAECATWWARHDAAANLDL